MAKEIERKFLVVNDSYKALSYRHISIQQGYIYTDKRAVIRVRIRDTDAFLTIKGENRGAERDEWEYKIPLSDAKEMLAKLSTGAIVAKTRYLIDFGGFKWEVDEFDSPVNGLIVAEIELPSSDTAFSLPPFIGKEITGDPAYYNSSIAAAGRLS